MSDARSKLSIVQQVGKLREAKTLDMVSLNERYNGVTFRVWVTPSRSHKEAVSALGLWLETETQKVKDRLDEIDDLDERRRVDEVEADRLNDEYNLRMVDWLSETWLDWDRDEVEGLYRALYGNPTLPADDPVNENTNPMAWDWLIEKTTEIIRDYRQVFVKN